MIGRKAVIGLSLLSALLFSAFAVQSASALVVKVSKNTTAFTCVKTEPNKGDLKDAHCDEKVDPNKGEYKHDAIALNTTTTVAATNQGVTKRQKNQSPGN